MLKSGIILLLIALFNVQYADAQRHVERHWTYDPFSSSEQQEEEVQWITDFSGWAEFGKFVAEKDTSHEYHHQLGAVMELVRWGDNSIAFGTQAEFIYDPNNNINFNPRSIFWEEGLFYTRKMDNHSWQLTYFHRCKHDLDNLELGLERVTINSSLGSRWIISDRDFLDGQLSVVPGAEIFVVTYDRRLPAHYQKEGLSWYQLLGAASGKFHWKREISGSLNYFVKGYGKSIFYGEGAPEGERLDVYSRFEGYEETRFSGSLHTGIEIAGKTGDFRLGMRYEYLDDAAINPVPESGSLLSITVQAFSSGRLF